MYAYTLLCVFRGVCLCAYSLIFPLWPSVDSRIPASRSQYNTHISTFFFHFSMYSTCKKPCFKCYALCMCIPIQFRQHQYTLAVLVVRCVLLSVFCLLFVSNSCYAMCDLFVSVCVSIWMWTNTKMEHKYYDDTCVWLRKATFAIEKRQKYLSMCFTDLYASS